MKICPVEEFLETVFPKDIQVLLARNPQWTAQRQRMVISQAQRNAAKAREQLMAGNLRGISHAN